MSALELLRTIVGALEALGIPFMLTGSMAAAAHGAGRATLDLDLVIAANADQLRSLAERLSMADLYVSADAALAALTSESMFNVVDTRTGWKADLIIRKSRPFSQSEFERRQPVDFEGIPLWVVTVEDMIVAKLEWARLGGSARQLEDVVSLLRVARDSIDREYLGRWVEELGLAQQWTAVRQMI